MAELKLTCPHCLAKIELDQAEASADFSRLASLAAKYGAAWDLVSDYLQSFRARGTGYVTLKKRVSLLGGELLNIWQYKQFTYNRRSYRTSSQALKKALYDINAMNKTGFKNHNYLKVILQDTAESLSAEGLTAADEQAREERRRSGAPRDDNRGGADLDKFRKRHGVKSITELIGKKGAVNEN